MPLYGWSMAISAFYDGFKVLNINSVCNEFVYEVPEKTGKPYVGQECH